MDLIYLDPPFFSNKTYEVIWGDEAEVRSFLDRWEGGVEAYTEWMQERVEQMHRVLAPTGSFYLHCDWHASHYLKVMCDGVLWEEALPKRGRLVLPRRWRLGQTLGPRGTTCCCSTQRPTNGRSTSIRCAWSTRPSPKSG